MKANLDLQKKYSDFSDEDLIERFRQGESEIMDYLMDKYKNLVKSKTKSLYVLGGESEDLLQEGMIGLFQAINDYDFGRDASFFTFAELCISRKVYSAIKKSNDKKHSFLNNYVSVIGSGDDETVDENGSLLIDHLSSDIDANPEYIAITKELRSELVSAIETLLTPLERENFELYLTGMSSGEVARVLGKSIKETDNSIQRAKAKLRKVVEKNND